MQGLHNYLQYMHTKNIFGFMAYNQLNRLRNIKEILAVYNREKNADLPDTRIVRQIFPKYGIHISYRTWMNIKGMKRRTLETVNV